jgi:uncharacterized Zn finger protein
VRQLTNAVDSVTLARSYEPFGKLLSTAGVSLFPAQRIDLTTSCSCPDWANPCKHIAATHYFLGERFDEVPFLLFCLRGRTQEQILQGLRDRRARQDIAENEETEEPEVVIPLEETLVNYSEIAKGRLENPARAGVPSSCLDQGGDLG